MNMIPQPRRRAVRTLAGALLAAACWAGLATGARAEELRIAIGGAFTSMDPHFHDMSTNVALTRHVFDGLTTVDANYRPAPGLAVSWRAIDDRTWEIKLREGVTFHDGGAFTADDVAFTFARIPEVPNAPARFTPYIRPVKRLEVVDAHTIRLHTADPAPTLPILLSSFGIVGRHQAEGATTADFNSGKAAIGTGPYRLVSFTAGDRAVFARNDAWWGPRQSWDEVTYRIIARGAARVAALKAGDVDVIDAVPTRDVAGLQADPKLAIFSAASLRLAFIYLDVGRAQTPFATDLDGKPLATNPLRDPRVRQALSLAINREGMRRQVMDGFSAPTGQMMPKGAMGYDPDLPPDPYDPARARALLAEAGYPNGFGLTLHGTNDRYVNDGAIIQAVAQMWTRIGVKTEVGSLPASMFFTRFAKDEFSASMTGTWSSTGEADLVIGFQLATPDPSRGRGSRVRESHYRDPALDALLDKAIVTLDPAAREDLYRQAVRLGMAQHPILPLHHEVNVWAVRKGITMTPPMIDQTQAMDFALQR